MAIPKFIALFLILLVNNVYSQDTISFTFDQFPHQSPDLIYQGDAHSIISESLRLTGTNQVTGAPLKNRAGRVMYRDPIQFWNAERQSSFETTIRFTITPVDGQPAEGIAFFIAPPPSNIPSGGYGENLGIFRPTGSVAATFVVEFDINPSGFWDPSFPHIGIDISSRNSDNVTLFNNAVGQVVTARINYEASTKMISVVATTGSQTYELSYVYDLKNILFEEVRVGISGSTGEGVALLDIHSWYFTSTLLNDPNSNNVQETYIRQYV